MFLFPVPYPLTYICPYILCRAPNQAAFELLKVVHALDAVIVLAATAEGDPPVSTQIISTPCLCSDNIYIHVKDNHLLSISIFSYYTYIIYTNKHTQSYKYIPFPPFVTDNVYCRSSHGHHELLPPCTDEHFVSTGRYHCRYGCNGLVKGPTIIITSTTTTAITTTLFDGDIFSPRQYQTTSASLALGPLAQIHQNRYYHTLSTQHNNTTHASTSTMLSLSSPRIPP